ncbi:hypothetical protein D3C85_1801180 [compost metagenome]
MVRDATAQHLRHVDPFPGRLGGLGVWRGRALRLRYGGTGHENLLGARDPIF